MTPVNLFISHSTDDNTFSEWFAAELITAGFEVWVDYDAIDLSNRWVQKIEEGLQACDAVVVIWSAAARRSEWVEREIMMAQDLKKPIYIARIEDIPRGLQIINLQFADFVHDAEKAMKKLISSMKKGIKPKKTLPAEPDEANFFQYMDQLPNGEQNAQIARELYKWAKKAADRVEFGGKVTPGFHAKVTLGADEVTVFSVWAYRRNPSVQVQFQYLMAYEPYTDGAFRRSTLLSLNHLLSDDMLIEEQADRRPTLPLSPALDTLNKMVYFQHAMEEIINNLRGQ